MTRQKVRMRNDMEFPPIDEFAYEVAEKALDEITYDGKTIREWIDILAKQQPCEENILKFYYVETLDDYWIGKRLDTMYYAEWDFKLQAFVWTYSKYLPWGEHVVEPNTLWKEYTYPSEPKEISFNEWIKGFLKKHGREQQPCDDTISRQAAIDAIAKIHPIDTEYDCTLYDKLDVMYVLKDLPPVTPQPKTGKWIRHPFYDYLVCSKCLSGAPYKYCETNYCPNCGSRMIEPQESEKQDMKSLQHI